MIEHRGYSVNALKSLLERARMSSTYKPALLRSLVERSGHGSDSIPLVALGSQFTRLYWSQTVRYGLRQAPRSDREPLVIQLIRNLSIRHKAREYRDLPQAAREQIAHEVAKVIRQQAIPLFHNEKPASMPLLYQWRRGEAALTMLPGARAFLQQYAATAELIANYGWAKKLEQWNRLAPRVIDKVEGRLRPRGDVRAKYLMLLLSIDPRCFYCRKPLEPQEAHLDHAISWNFMLDDRLWDLVPACIPCNQAKSKALPPPEFMERLEQRNAGPLRVKAKPTDMQDASDLAKLYEAAILNEWPVWAGPVSAF